MTGSIEWYEAGQFRWPHINADQVDPSVLLYIDVRYADDHLSATLSVYMSITLEEAKLIVEDYKNSHSVTDFASEIIEQENFWYFQVGFIGSSGVIVNKSDGRLFIMGSALTNEEIFWGHENGFSPEKVDIEILEVNNPLKVSGMVGGLLVQLGKAPTHPNRAAREIARELIKELSQKFHGVSLWLEIPWFREAIEHGWLNYKINEHQANT